MIDIELVRNEPDALKASLAKRGTDGAVIDEVAQLDKARRNLIGEVESIRAERNTVAKEVGKLRSRGEDASQQQRRAGELKDKLAQLEIDLTKAQETLDEVIAGIPNVPDEQTPAGGKEANEVLRTWGTKPNIPESAPDHVDLSNKLGLVDHERGVKLSGSGHWIYTRDGAALEWALIDFFCREHYKDGYDFLLPPHMLLDQCGFAAGQFPKFREDVFHVETGDEDRKKFLIPTAETAILNVYRDEILPESMLPVKAFAYTPCYRQEAGGYRTEERGTVRGHQFNKVELFQFCAAEDGEKAFNELVGKAEALVQKLGLHYQTTRLAAGDVSASMSRTYDIEVWIPSMQTYKEVSSVSWARDYQARRANIRHRVTGQKKPSLIHTLNGSGLATSRLLPAILEQNQNPDGSVTIPEPLRAWLGKDKLTPLAAD